ncbi:MAG: ISNCY family transposase [Mariprofundaceae bacterium]
MRFHEAYNGWKRSHLTQEEAGLLLGMSGRNFRRYIERYHEEGEVGLLDKRLTQASHRCAPVDEVLQLTDLYSDRYNGWNVKHFYSFYIREHEGTRSYSWVKNELQKADLVKKAKGKGKHRKRRERAAMEGMMIHQDGSDHEWVPGVRWDLIITLDDATSTHYSMRFVKEEGTASSFMGMRDVIESQGLPSSFYSDRGSHYWHTPEAGGKVDKDNPTQFGRAMKHLGIEMIAAYSPEARGRCERMFSTHQERLPKELAAAGITDMDAANVYLEDKYMSAFNDEFAVKPAMEAKAFVQWFGGSLGDILCEQHERTVNKDNTVSFKGRILQIPSDEYRNHYVKTRVRVHHYIDDSLAIFHGPRKLADFPPPQKKEPRKPELPFQEAMK